MSNLVSLREERQKLITEMEATLKGDVNREIALEVRTKNQRLGELNDEIALLVEADEAKAQLAKIRDSERNIIPVPFPGGGDGARLPRFKSIHELLHEHKVEEAFRNGKSGTVKFSYGMFDPAGGPFGGSSKTLITLGDIAPQAELMPGFVPYAHETRTTGDLMLQGSTNTNSITYYEMTTRTNAAAEVAESTQAQAATKPESAFDWTLRTDPVETIATWVPVTRQALEDVSFLESMIREELRFMVKEREELQILVGNGTSPNISGILDRTGIQTQAKGADNVPDAIYKAITLVRNTGFAEPTAVVMHPNDWQAIRLLTTVDGIYIWGPPSQSGEEMIWGLPVRVTSNMTENTALVGAFRPWSKRVMRSDVEITLSTEHSTYFVENKVAILAEERLALQVTRPAAFCTVTGI